MTAVLRHRIRSGAYHDSIVLMRLQSSLASLEGIQDAGAVMATETNRALLRSNQLMPDPEPEAGPDDLLISVRAESVEHAETALGEIDALLAYRSQDDDGSWRPRSLRGASKILPDARWVLISVPGRYAAEVARDALDRGRNIFLYSDNVPLHDERQLKQIARDRGLLVLGPDCGTAVIGGTGLGFANRVRRGPIGLIAASGTGLQAVMCRIHDLGEGISQAIGTGGRDLHDQIGAISTLQALDLLAQDPWTRVITLISKPPSPAVATRILRAAEAVGKPIVVSLLGYPAPGSRLGHLHFARDLEEAAELAVSLLKTTSEAPKLQRSESSSPSDSSQSSKTRSSKPQSPRPQSPRRFIRGLFSGGTLAYEALLCFRTVLSPISSNLKAEGVENLVDPTGSRGHCIVDLGDDALTVGRLHPMMDPDAARRRLIQEAADPETAVILMDVVLGDVAHIDPASTLVDTLNEINQREDPPAIVLSLIGTDEDPQGLESQIEAFSDTGAHVFSGLRQAIDRCLRLIPLEDDEHEMSPRSSVAATDLQGPIKAWNVGLESLHDSLQNQESEVIHVEWRPPAGGDEQLAALLRKMKPRP